MRSQACAQVISGWRRRRPSPKRRSTAPLAIGVTPGSSAASSSERARCRGGAGASGGQGEKHTDGTAYEGRARGEPAGRKFLGVMLPDCLHPAGAPCLLPVSRLGRLPGGSTSAPLQLDCPKRRLARRARARRLRRGGSACGSSRPPPRRRRARWRRRAQSLPRRTGRGLVAG